jgi:ElaB/YqjD/DUF883 family membrane-anchored ribosome-binding protein
MQQVTTEKLVQDLRTVVTDAEELLKATAGQTGERIEKVRDRAEQSVRDARTRLEAAGRDLDGQVHDNAWTAVGIAAGVGLIAGILLSRK